MANGWQEYTITDLNPMISQRTRRLMTDEGQLGALAVENLVYDNFESGWNQLPLERKELALEGHFRGSRPSPRENSGVICPELTIDGLLGDGEYNVINLVSISYCSRGDISHSVLKWIMAHDPTGNRRAKDLYLFVHPYVEHKHRHSDDAPDLLKGKAMPFLSRSKDSHQAHHLTPGTNPTHAVRACV
jgi:hypothetical protein